MTLIKFLKNFDNVGIKKMNINRDDSQNEDNSQNT